jgi:GSH-dependent disulfide-bond oxidoreductase
MSSTTQRSSNGSKPIQLYSLATPNGQKIGIALEEFGLEYDAHTVDIRKGAQFGKWKKTCWNDVKRQYSEDWFKAINPNSKIPAIIDHQPANGSQEPITVFESGAILIYLADRSGKYLAPIGTAQRYETLEWLMWQMGGVGPMFGQANYFHRSAKEQIEHAKERYLNEAKRLLTVLDVQLTKTRAFVSGNDYTIADMAIYPWVTYFLNNYKEQLSDNNYEHVRRWCTTIEQRPQVVKGMKVCSFD